MMVVPWWWMPTVVLPDTWSSHDVGDQEYGAHLSGSGLAYCPKCAGNGGCASVFDSSRLARPSYSTAIGSNHHRFRAIICHPIAALADYFAGDHRYWIARWHQCRHRPDAIWHRPVSPVGGRWVQLDHCRNPVGSHRTGVFVATTPIHRGATTSCTGYSDRFTCGGRLHNCPMYRRCSIEHPLTWHTVHRRISTQNSRRNSHRYYPDAGSGRGNRWHPGSGRQVIDAMAEAGGMNIIQETFTWLTSGSTWNEAGNDLLGRSLEHLQYSGMAVAIAAVIAIPAGWSMGHTGRFAGLVVAITGAAGAL